MMVNHGASSAISYLIFPTKLYLTDEEIETYKG